MTGPVIVLVIATLTVITGLAMMLRALNHSADPSGEGFGPPRMQMVHSRLHDRVLWRRAGITLGAAIAAGLFTGWPVAAVLAGASCWFLPALIGRDTATTAQIARIEAIASWAEMMRDTLSAAAGLQQAILATAAAAPAPIRKQVTEMAEALGRGARLEDALRAFGRELTDPTGDLIVAALILSSRRQARNLTDVLGSLAQAARAQAGLRMRTAADRARTRTSVRMIVGTVLALAVGLILLNRSYLAPYSSASGQLVLLVIAAMFALSTLWLARIAQGKPAPRFLTRLDADETDRSPT